MIIKRKIKITNPQGLHARPASLFVKIANRYESELTVKKGREMVNGKSIMGLMTLAANQGSWLYLEASGPDALELVGELEIFLTRDSQEEKSKESKS